MREAKNGGGGGYASGFSFSFFFEEEWGCDFEAKGWRDVIFEWGWRDA